MAGTYLTPTSSWPNCAILLSFKHFEPSHFPLSPHPSYCSGTSACMYLSLSWLQLAPVPCPVASGY